MSDSIKVPQFSSEQKLTLRHFQICALTASQAASNEAAKVKKYEQIFHQLLREFVKVLNLPKDKNFTVDFATLELTPTPKS